MKKNNQKGFTLILSLVLLLVMSLMGGALIVISSGDHQSNNTSDQYQQTFYVAEHALIEAEKRIINRMIGPWTEINSISSAPVGSTPTETTAHNNYIDQLRATAIDGLARHTDGRDTPRNTVTPTETPCFKSFRNLIRTDGGGDLTLVTDHFVNLNFGSLIEPILDSAAKVQALEAAMQRLEIGPEAVLAVGDGSNDIPMLRRAGLGVAWRGKPVVKAQTRARIDFGDLSTLLIFQRMDPA